MSQEPGPQQQGCSCTNMFLMLAFFAGAPAGGVAGFHLGTRVHGWWGGVLGTGVGAVLGAITGMLAGVLLVIAVGLVACGMLWLEERQKALREKPQGVD